jgi:hypothetical protein
MLFSEYVELLKCYRQKRQVNAEHAPDEAING